MLTHPLWGIVFLKGPSCIFACHWVDFEYLQENNKSFLEPSWGVSFRCSSEPVPGFESWPHGIFHHVPLNLPMIFAWIFPHRGLDQPPWHCQQRQQRIWGSSPIPQAHSSNATRRRCGRSAPDSAPGHLTHPGELLGFPFCGYYMVIIWLLYGYLPSGKRLQNYGKIHFLMDKSTISMAIFNSELFVYQRVLGFLWRTIWLVVSTYPSEKWWTSSVGIMTFPTEWTNKSHVPNHQPAISIQLWKTITNHSYNYSHWAKLQPQLWPSKTSYK